MSPYLKSLREKIGHDLVLIPGVAGLVRDEEGRLLLQRRRDDNQWSLPAGAVDPGEEPARAVIREVWEETGLKVRPARVVGVFGGPAFRHVYPNGDEVEATTILFECRAVGGKLECRDGESVELRYFRPEELPDLLMPYPRHLFAAVREGADPFFQWEDEWLAELGTGS